ncbi:hypothetical protein QTP88_023850 [Uroleucon formosanum]
MFKGDLERKACEMLLEEIVGQDCKIDLFLTDRHKGIRYDIRTKFPEIQHEFDIWHLSKSVMRRMKVFDKKYPDAYLWKTSINNHLWWSSKTCKEDGLLFTQKFRSRTGGRRQLGTTNSAQSTRRRDKNQRLFFLFGEKYEKKLCELGLTNHYNNEPNFSLYAKMVTALAFVPIEDIDNALLSLSENLPDDVQPILDWFEDNYVGRMNRRGNGRRQPLFHHEMWNVYNRTLNQQDRTNNHTEAVHRRLQAELGMDHPTIWKLIDVLRKVQANRDFYYEHLVAGHNPPVKLKMYRDADQRILTIVWDYYNRDVVEHLRGIVHNYQINL